MAGSSLFVSRLASLKVGVLTSTTKYWDFPTVHHLSKVIYLHALTKNPLEK